MFKPLTAHSQAIIERCKRQGTGYTILANGAVRIEQHGKAPRTNKAMRCNISQYAHRRAKGSKVQARTCWQQVVYEEKKIK